MATLIRPRAWGQTKPVPGSTIDWGHPLAQGLLVALPLNEGRGFPRELVTGKSTFIATGAMAWAPTGRGGGFSSASGASIYLGNEGANGLILPTVSGTVMIAKWRTVGGNAVSSSFGVSATAGAIMQAHHPYSDGTVYWDFGGNSGNNRLSVAGLTYAKDDIWTFTAGRYGMTIWQNSVLVGTKATAITRSASAAAGFALGNWLAGGGPFAGETEARYSFFYIWNRELNPAEIRWLQVEPYAFFKAPGSPRFTIDAISATQVAAGVASATGAALQPTISVAPNTGVATATSAALNANVSASAPAETASATGSANAPALSIAVNPGLATATGAALDPAVTVGAIAAAGVATATAAALAPAVSIAPTVGSATGTGAALDPAVTTSVSDTADAGVATATGAALSPSVSLAPSVGVATAKASVVGAFEGGAFEGSAFELPAFVSIGASAVPAAATGTGLNANVSATDTAPAGTAQATSQAHDASVTTSASSSANAGAALAIAAAYDATVAVSAVTPRRHGGPPLRAATITGRAPRRRPHVRVHAGVAQAIGRAYDARIEWNDDEIALLLLLGAL